MTPRAPLLQMLSGTLLALAVTQAPAQTAPIVPVGGEEPLVIPDLPVTSDQGRQAPLRTLLPADAPVIMGFTYTSCDSICDVTNAILLDVDQRLAASNDSRTRIVTISIDPANDSPARLAAARAELEASDHWLMLTAGMRGTRPLLEALRVPTGRIENHEMMFLVGRPCAGRMTRILSFADPEMLLALAATLPPCEG